MTTVKFLITKPDRSGTNAPASATVRFTPTRVRVTGSVVGELVLPVAFTAATDELGALEVALEATTAEWAWRIEIYATGTPAIAQFASVPDIEWVSFTDLPKVDPTTLEPSAEPEAAWWAALESAETGAAASAQSASEDATSAANSASAAAASSLAAQDSASDAATSATVAATSEANAASSAEDAAASATASAASRDTAASSATASAGSATTAKASSDAAALSETNAANSATNAANAANTAVSNHVAASDPHTQYARKTGPTDVAGARHTSGTGIPEGVVTAPVGARYIDTAATSGAVEWIKATGTGNTGWRVVHGDTGWRSLPATVVANGVTSGNIRYRRQGNRVTCSLQDVLMSTAVPGLCVLATATEVPTGFRQDSTKHRSMQNVGLNNNATQPQVITMYGAISWVFQIIPGASPTTTRPSVALFGTIFWDTDDAWPAVLPGTPG